MVGDSKDIVAGPIAIGADQAYYFKKDSENEPVFQAIKDDIGVVISLADGGKYCYRKNINSDLEGLKRELSKLKDSSIEIKKIDLIGGLPYNTYPIDSSIVHTYNKVNHRKGRSFVFSRSDNSLAKNYENNFISEVRSLRKDPKYKEFFSGKSEKNGYNYIIDLQNILKKYTNNGKNNITVTAMMKNNRAGNTFDTNYSITGLENFIGYINLKDIKGTLGKVFGSDIEKKISHFMTDINQNITIRHDGIAMSRVPTALLIVPKNNKGIEQIEPKPEYFYKNLPDRGGYRGDIDVDNVYKAKDIYRNLNIDGILKYGSDQALINIIDNEENAKKKTSNLNLHNVERQRSNFNPLTIPKEHDISTKRERKEGVDYTDKLLSSAKDLVQMGDEIINERLDQKGLENRERRKSRIALTYQAERRIEESRREKEKQEIDKDVALMISQQEKGIQEHKNTVDSTIILVQEMMKDYEGNREAIKQCMETAISSLDTLFVNNADSQERTEKYQELEQEIQAIELRRAKQKRQSYNEEYSQIVRGKNFINQNPSIENRQLDLRSNSPSDIKGIYEEPVVLRKEIYKISQQMEDKIHRKAIRGDKEAIEVKANIDANHERLDQKGLENRERRRRIALEYQEESRIEESRREKEKQKIDKYVASMISKGEQDIQDHKNTFDSTIILVRELMADYEGNREAIKDCMETVRSSFKILYMNNADSKERTQKYQKLEQEIQQIELYRARHKNKNFEKLEKEVEEFEMLRKQKMDEQLSRTYIQLGHDKEKLDSRSADVQQIERLPGKMTKNVHEAQRQVNETIAKVWALESAEQRGRPVDKDRISSLIDESQYAFNILTSFPKGTSSSVANTIQRFQEISDTLEYPRLTSEDLPKIQPHYTVSSELYDHADIMNDYCNAGKDPLDPQVSQVQGNSHDISGYGSSRMRRQHNLDDNTLSNESESRRSNREGIHSGNEKRRSRHTGYRPTRER